MMLCSLEMPKDELPNHNCIKHLRSVVQQQQTRIAELEKTSAEHKHQLAEQVGPGVRAAVSQRGLAGRVSLACMGTKHHEGFVGEESGCRAAREGLCGRSAPVAQPLGW